MASAEPSQSKEAKKKDTEGPLRTMSIARFIPRFTKPRLLTSNIPTYRHSFSLPESELPSPATPSVNAETSGAKEVTKVEDSVEELEHPSNASYVEWNKLLPVPSNLLASFQDLFEKTPRLQRPASGDCEAAQASVISDESHRSASPPPRLVFFGEQHHQPQVMRAQLQTLYALHQQCQLASDPIQPQPAKASPVYRLHLILEHFSVLDQDMLNSFSKGMLGPDELAETYQTQSEESFNIGHYMPLLMLAKELNVPIWGGFPPRQWARQVFRDGVEAVKPDEERRVTLPSGKLEDTTATNLASDVSVTASEPLIQSPLFTSWNAVTKISAAHRSYLSSLMRPDLPPRFPHLPDAAADATQSSSRNFEQSHSDAARHSPIYPTWLLKPHNIETKGFGPAQALKDSYLAHVTAWILRGARQNAADTDGSATASPASSSQSSAVEASDASRPVVNVALVVCGLGHCEYGFGAPERVVQLLSQQGSSHSEGQALLPYIIASKPFDSGIWLGYEHPLQSESEDGSSKTDADTTTDPKLVEDSIERPQTMKQKPVTADTVQQWLHDPWGRKMADAVLLYDWIDDEPAGEATGNADGHQPTTEQPKQNTQSD